MESFSVTKLNRQEITLQLKFTNLRKISKKDILNITLNFDEIQKKLSLPPFTVPLRRQYENNPKKKITKTEISFRLGTSAVAVGAVKLIMYGSL